MHSWTKLYCLDMSNPLFGPRTHFRTALPDDVVSVLLSKQQKMYKQLVDDFVESLDHSNYSEYRSSLNDHKTSESDDYVFVFSRTNRGHLFCMVFNQSQGDQKLVDLYKQGLTVRQVLEGTYKPWDELFKHKATTTLLIRALGESLSRKALASRTQNQETKIVAQQIQAIKSYDQTDWQEELMMKIIKQMS